MTTLRRLTVLSVTVLCLLLPASASRAHRAADLWSWPLLPAPSVAAGFDPPAERWGRGHRGVDLLAFPLQPVLSPAPGMAHFTGTIAGVGVVSIRHSPTLRSTYQPVIPLVKTGQLVLPRQPIGLVVPAVHCPPRTCLHWGAIRHRAQYVDPLSFLGVVRLLPLR